MRITPLHENFGCEVHDVDLRALSKTVLYPEIRTLFEEHSLLLFRDQQIDDPTHRHVAGLFGPRENLTDHSEDASAPIASVSNRAADGSVLRNDDLDLLNLQSNFLWHTDSTFYTTPALSNVLTAYVVPTEGGQTELVSTRAGWNRLGTAMKEQLRQTVIWHHYSTARKRISPELGALEMFNRYPPTAWRAVWTNPVNGREALYLAAHAFGVAGMAHAEAQDFLNDLMEAVTTPDAIYSHAWRPGDVLIWDQRATMHRGTPWPYEEERTLASIVSSAGEEDGIASVRPDTENLKPLEEDHALAGGL